MPQPTLRLDAVLITHSDNDHYSLPTCRQLAPVTTTFRSTRYVDTLMRAAHLPLGRHNIGDRFTVNQVHVEVTPTDHAWQNENPGAADRIFQPEDCCGFWIDTPDGTVWAPGDSRLIPDHHLQMPTRTPCCSTSPTANGTWASTAPSPWRTPTHRRRCCSTTGAASSPRLPTLQRRPSHPARPGREPRPDHPAPPGEPYTLHPLTH